MACVTLKRSLELEPLYSPSGSAAKRRRCAPLTPLFARTEQSNFELCSGKHSSISSSKLQETRREFGDNGSSHQQATSGPFSSLPMPSNDEIYLRIKQEMKRLKRRKQLKYAKSGLGAKYHGGNRAGGSASCGSSSGSDDDCGPPGSPVAASVALRREQRERTGGDEGEVGALFTLDQVVTICNKLLVDRDNTLREEYDRALTEKLAEQYDAFVKFTHDQIQGRLSHSASYVS